MNWHKQHNNKIYLNVITQNSLSVFLDAMQLLMKLSVCPYPKPVFGYFIYMIFVEPTFDYCPSVQT